MITRILLQQNQTEKISPNSIETRKLFCENAANIPSGSAMHSNSCFSKLLSLVVIIALFAMRLSFLSEEVFVIPVEDAIFHVAFIADEDSPSSTKILKVNAKRALDLLLLPQEEVSQPAEPPQPLLKPACCVLILKDIAAEIFIPPEVVS
jgi:hypothetical protein